MGTMWADDKGNWVITQRSAPFCMGCPGHGEEVRRDETSVTTVPNSIMTMQISEDGNTAMCPRCMREMTKQPEGLAS